MLLYMNMHTAKNNIKEYDTYKKNPPTHTDIQTKPQTGTHSVSNRKPVKIEIFSVCFDCRHRCHRFQATRTQQLGNPSSSMSLGILCSFSAVDY